MPLPIPAIELAEEIRSLVQDDDLTRATKRLLDYSKQFAKQQEVKSAIVLSRELKNIERDTLIFGDSPQQKSQLNALAYRLLTLLDEAESAAKEQLQPMPPDVTEEGQPENEEEVIRGGSRLEEARIAFASKRELARRSEALIARGIRKAYRGGFTISDIDLTLRCGEITGVVGVNGSGKTTLLRILAGELAADGGDLSYPALCGEELDWIRIRSRIAYVPQQPSRWNGILEENLYLYAALDHLTGRTNETEVEFILHRLGLESYRKARWTQISGGFQMRFELARALVGKPSLLILDEPLAPLDISTQQVFIQDLRDIANSFPSPVAIILSSQHIAEIEAIADSVLFLNDGKVAYSGTLERLYLERKENKYELTSSARKHQLIQYLEPLGISEVNHAGHTYLINTPPTVTGRKLLELLFEADVDITYFRDISKSTRKFFWTGE